MRIMDVMAVIPGIDWRGFLHKIPHGIPVRVLVAFSFLIPIGDPGCLTSPFEGAPCLGVCGGLAEFDKVSCE